jgi:2'-5' RNA ligase
MRLFVAVNFPLALRTGIWRAAAPLRDAELPVRWVAESELHLTLKFLGETAGDQVTGIVAAIEKAVNGTRSFVMPVGGFGVFPSLERPRVFWVGCDGVPPLELLQHGLEVATERLGFPVEGRPFRPHLTVGRAKKDAAARSFRDVGALLEGLEYQAECFVGSIDLMESKPGPRGAKYQVVHSVPLGTGNE